MVLLCEERSKSGRAISPSAQVESWEFDSLCQDAQLLAETREPRVGMEGMAHDFRTVCLTFQDRDLTSLVGSQWWKEERPVPLRKTGSTPTFGIS